GCQLGLRWRPGAGPHAGQFVLELVLRLRLGPAVPSTPQRDVLPAPVCVETDRVDRTLAARVHYNLPCRSTWHHTPARVVVVLIVGSSVRWRLRERLLARRRS